MEQVIKKRDIKLSNCNISKAKYNELRYFCLQYEEKKKELEQCRDLKPKEAAAKEKQDTEDRESKKKAARSARLRRDLELIEQTAREAGPDISQWLMKNLVEGTVYESLEVPLSRTKFYDIRRYFFYLLAQKR